MRGKGVTDKLEIVRERITPAHAGKSFLSSSKVVPRRDHPRPCGEKRPTCARNPISPGSPPPMRGKVVAFSCVYASDGITPAHAGKSCTRATTRPRWQDHPRPCGEKTSKVSASVTIVGSPPPMRGKELIHYILTRPRRITPAHAGKSLPYYSAPNAG